MKLSNLTFDQDSRLDVLELFDKTVDDEGFIVEISSPQDRVLTPKGEEILLDEWAGVVKGSEVFVKKDAFSLMELAKRIE